MPLLGFKKEMAKYIENGSKLHTIRAFRRDGRDPKPGDILYMYVGLRTKACRKIAEKKCLYTKTVEIKELGYCIWIDDESLDFNDAARLACSDGFRVGGQQENVNAFMDFFRKNHGLPFRGLLIGWGKEVKYGD